MCHRPRTAPRALDRASHDSTWRIRSAGLALALLGTLVVLACGGTAPQDVSRVPLRERPGIPDSGPAAKVAGALQQTFDEIWNATRDEALPAADKRTAVAARVAPWLDRTTLARAALGPLGERFSPRERETFDEAYADYVTALLVDRFARDPDRPVEVERARHDPDRGTILVEAIGGERGGAVRGIGTRRSAPGERIHVELLLRQRAGEWRIVALSLNEVDVSRSFREQFDAVLRRSEPAALVEALAERNDRIAERNPFAD